MHVEKLSTGASSGKNILASINENILAITPAAMFF